MNLLTKTEIIFELIHAHPNSDGTAFFGTEVGGPHLEIPRSTWEDMGEPLKITVTIEPGDLLNDDGSPS